MKIWSVYVLSDTGKHVVVMRVHAETESGAKDRAQRHLQRPGRLSIYFRWVDCGRLVKLA